MTAERKLEAPSPSMRFTLSPDMSPEEIKALTDQPVMPEYSTSELPEELKWLEEFKLQFHQSFMPKDSDSVTRSRCFLNFRSQDSYTILRHYL